MDSKRDEQIRRRAHQLWEREGRQHGQHEKHWHQASREIDDEASSDQASADGTGLEAARSNADAPLGEAVARAKRARTPKSASKPATRGKVSSAPKKAPKK